MKTRHQGFTLVELMIALAVISLLLALALPVYRDYRIRAAFSEGLNVASQMKLVVNEHVFTEGNPHERLRQIGWLPGAIGKNPIATEKQLAGYRPYRTFNGKPGSYNFWVEVQAGGEIFVRMMGDETVRCRPGPNGGGLTVVLVPTLDANATALSWSCQVHNNRSMDPACVPAVCQTPYTGIGR